ncbi:unnamed protein product [Brachionus calyciflorus]|uniref:Uncharacterized protein n=1 Tax=Brachionus calyciflorus TaxID=104777 RepID=A0A814NQZ9_9BILA|nr:unnamed protein product [Brachionus calyciflorus]
MNTSFDFETNKNDLTSLSLLSQSFHVEAERPNAQLNQLTLNDINLKLVNNSDNTLTTSSIVLDDLQTSNSGPISATCDSLDSTITSISSSLYTSRSKSINSMCSRRSSSPIEFEEELFEKLSKLENETPKQKKERKRLEKNQREKLIAEYTFLKNEKIRQKIIKMKEENLNLDSRKRSVDQTKKRQHEMPNEDHARTTTNNVDQMSKRFRVLEDGTVFDENEGRIASQYFQFRIQSPPTNLTKQIVYDKLESRFEQLIVADSKEIITGFVCHLIFLKVMPNSNGKCKEQPYIIKEYLREVYGNDCYIEMYGVKNVKDSIANVTRDDTNPVFKHVDSNNFSWYSQAIHFISKNKKIDHLDPFVVRNWSKTNVLEKMLAEHEERQFVMVEWKVIVQKRRYGNWRDQIIDWFNNWILTGISYKKKQLYLYGLSDTGKSTFIRDLFRHYYKPQRQVFIPTPFCEKHAWSGFKPNKQNIVICDEFNFEKYSVDEWKLVVAGELVSNDIKYQVEKHVFQINVPMIFISNYSCIHAAGVRERLLIVESEGIVDKNNAQNMDDYIETFVPLSQYIDECVQKTIESLLDDICSTESFEYITI